MRSIVVILGAGASAGAGLPTLGSIFRDSSVQLYLESDAHELKKFLQEYVCKPRGISFSEIDTALNLEEILTMLRQWRTRPKGSGGQEPNPQSPINHKRNGLLQRQLLGCVYNSVYVNKSGKGATEYNQLLKLVDSEFDKITWASFNWDALLEQAFYWAFYKQNRFPRCHPDLGLWPGNDEKHLLLKLHGSVTWFAKPNGDVFYVPYGKTKSRNDVSKHWQDYLTETEGCAEPMIAEPSFFKHEDLAQRPFLLKQWELFGSALSDADLILCVGYSLPDGDAMAKQAILTAIARKRLSRVVVVDPDGLEKSDRTRAEAGVMHRYRRVVGAPRLIEQRCFLYEFLADTHTLLQ